MPKALNPNSPRPGLGEALSVDGTIGTVLTAAEAALSLRPDNAQTIHGVRRFGHGETGKRIIYFNSRVNRALIACEGFAEASVCLHLERERPALQAYRTQPLTVGLSHSVYTPDLLVLTADGSLHFLEVKVDASKLTVSVKRKLDEAKAVFARQGFRFQIASLSEIHDPSDNGQLRGCYDPRDKRCIPSDLARFVSQLFASRPRLTLSTLSTILDREGWGSNWINRLIFERYVSADMRPQLREQWMLSGGT